MSSRVVRLASSLTLLLLFALPGVGRADEWPSRTVHIVLTFPPGGPSDLLARALAQKLSEQTKQSVVIDNRPGGSGLIGNDLVAKAAPDGYMLGLPSAGSMSIVPNLLPLPYDRDRDLLTITLVARVPEIVVVSPKTMQATTLAEVVAYAKAHPGALNFGSTGNGSPVHLVLERIKQLAGVDIVHVPYRGAALALTDILAGQIDMTAADAPGLLPYIKAGTLRPIANSDTVRLPALPDVPTFAEAGLPGVEMVNWYVLIAPHGLPPALAARIHDTVATALRDPGLNATLSAQGLALTVTSQPETAAWIQSETKKWGDVARAAHVKLD